MKRTKCIPLRAPPVTTTVWPDEYFEVSCKSVSNDIATTEDCTFALEPRIDSTLAKRNDTLWPTHAVIQSVAGKIRIPNDTDYPIVVKRNEHLAQVSPVFYLGTTNNISHSAPSKFEQPVKPTLNHLNVTIDTITTADATVSLLIFRLFLA